MSSHPRSGPVFIGRDDEIAQLEAALEHAISGRGRLVLLSGPPGIGKSRLTAEFIQKTNAKGVTILLGRSWEAGGAPSYWPWVQAIRGHLRTTDPGLLKRHIAGGAAVLMAMFPELGEMVSSQTPRAKGDPASDRFQLFDAFTTYLGNVAGSEPLVIVLEDLQAADAPTLLLLEFVSNQIAETAILVVATYRDVELSPEHPLTGTLASLHRSPATVQLALPGLDAHEVARFVEVIAGPAAASTLAGTLYRQTNGNPLFLGEAVRLLASSEDGVAASMARVVIPAEIRTVIERRLEVLSSDDKRMLEMLSVLGNEFDVEVAARLVDLEVGVLLDLVGEAVTSGLVVEGRGGPGTIGFAHDLIRQTLYAGLSPAMRTRIHRQAAAVLEETYGDEKDEHLAELALHYFEAAAGGDHAKAVEYGRRAGEQAIRRLAYEEAVRLLEMAVQVLDASDDPDPSAHGHLLLALGDARVRAGDLPGAGTTFRRTAEVARRLGDTRLLAQAAIGYGGRFIWSRAGDDTEMVPLLQDALVLLGGQDDKLRVRLLSRLACATRSIGDRDHDAALARQGLELARELGDPLTLSYALSGLLGATWWPENPGDRMELGRELISISESVGAIEGVVDGHIARCAAHAEMGDFAAARRELSLLEQAGRPLRLVSQRWLEGALSALFALSDGVFEEAEKWIDEMLRQRPTTPARDNIAAAMFQLFLLRREQGRLSEVEGSVREAAAEFAWYPINRLALADLLTRTGREGEARAIVSELGADSFALFQRDNYWLASMCLASEIVVRLGDRQLAKTLTELLMPFAEMNALGFPEGSFGAVTRYLGLLAVFEGDHDSAVRWFEEALPFNERNGARPLVAHVHHDLAQALMARRRPGDETEAGTHLRTALSLCDDVGLDMLREEVETALSSLAGPLHAEPEIRPREAFFRREGEYVSVGFEGEGFKVKETKGMRYLGMLLVSPGREIHVLDLVAVGRGVEGSQRASKPEAESHGIGELSTPVIDRAARKAYESRLIELQEDISEAESFGDDARAALARQEHDFLSTELAAALGLGGRDRALASNAERARVNVTRAIRTAVARIDSYSSLLGRHLDQSIQTGVFCSYNPDPIHPIRWNS
jgi:tetratricopeptide (TPR) repeat protein